MHWDLSWHRSIGRDTFWTPAHLLAQFCGVLMGFSSVAIILKATLRPDSAITKHTVRIWGFRGPLGSFLGAWGGLAMVTSVPLDDWWHSAYGLDVKIFSPPHVVLWMGIVSVQIGGLILIAAAANRASSASGDGVLDTLFLFNGSMVLVMTLFLTYEYSQHVYMHTAFFYLVLSITVPVLLAALKRASHLRWATTIAAGIYMALICAFVWFLPLFPAEPKLGPVYHEVTHFVPPEFPLLLIVPAIAWDLLMPRIGGMAPWRQATIAGLVFFCLLFVTQWNFGVFLNSPAARNRFFAADEFSYLTQPTAYAARYLFVPHEASFGTLLIWAAIAAIVSTRAGLAVGEWLRGVRR